MHGSSGRGGCMRGSSGRGGCMRGESGCMHSSSVGETEDNVSASAGDWEQVGGSSISASPRASRWDSKISDKGMRVSVLGIKAAASTGGWIFSLLCERVDKAGGGFEQDRGQF